MLDRVVAKIDASGDCWEWTGAHLPSGYGHAYAGGATVLLMHDE